jgi:outer membrane protein OmpA-like peptidoglycan-associated protein
MNKMCHTPTFYRFVPAILFFSFIIAGCAGSPTETRYDDRMKTYVSANDENVATYAVGEHGKATAHYILRPGNRPEFQHRTRQTKTVQSGAPSYEEQVANLKMVIDVSDVLFDFDKWVIKQSVVPDLDQWVVFFQKNPKVTAEIDGHADSIGPTAYNQNLSLKRAQAVANYLIRKGVNPKRLTIKGFGESQPVAPNTTSEGRQKNRRVEMKL